MKTLKRQWARLKSFVRRNADALLNITDAFLPW
ncbi:hypothetical protein FDI14_gp134 [Mycobacterium phage SirDuracell]|uniref:Uncharacterized protein n=6 Tax=Kostyavirus TaxID=1623284 RepID=G1D5Y3_9CAUD|nr:hypothetical protein Kostya_119 [Mycobacterium phage Kostya]YP_008409511.1 hypothetical protein DRDREY_120 [Mycobacterium phage DrDrey]YP_009591278.1 hypothetical protein FDG56_gp136 [Mycobacterium phage Bask21]YP_009608048.1 hypothetical protein FDI14_gp134 [Mycobacterium phage SirDuracell]AEK08966.1 hypothetical protein PBI_HENRY_118 [Mycobacterium phage Henry]ATN92534.1 hypothetical protein SEA_WILLEZ_111 [Mycobacterium phage Willez]AXH47659.1 hypothetical protein SEA_IHOP_118 [Mycobact